MSRSFHHVDKFDNYLFDFLVYFASLQIYFQRLNLCY